MSQKSMQHKTAQEAGLEQAVTNKWEKDKLVPESSYDKRKSPQLQGMTSLSIVSENTGIPHFFIKKRGFAEKEQRWWYVRDDKLPELQEAYNNRKTLKAPEVEGMTHILKAAKLIGCGRDYPKLKKACRKIEDFLYVRDEKIPELKQGYEKRKLPGSIEIKGMVFHKEAAALIGCSPTHSLILKHREKIQGCWYVPETLIPNLKKNYKAGVVIPPNLISLDDAVEKSGLPRTFIREHGGFEKYGIRLFIDETTLPNLKKLYDNRCFIGVPDDMLLLDDAVKKSKLPKYFVREHGEFKKYKGRLFLSETNLSALKNLYDNRHLIGVPDDMLLLDDAIRKSGLPRFFVRENAELERHGRRLILKETSLPELIRAYKSRDTSKAPKIPGFTPMAKAAKFIDCSPTHPMLKKEAEMIKSYWYVKNDKLRPLKREYARSIHEKIERRNAAQYKEKRQVFFKNIENLNEIIKILKKSPEETISHPLLVGLEQVFSLLPSLLKTQEDAYKSKVRTLEKRIEALKGKINFGVNQEASYKGLKNYMDTRVLGEIHHIQSANEQFYKDIKNEIEYSLDKIRISLQEHVDKILCEAAEKTTPKGDYFRGGRLTDLTKKEYKYLYRPLQVIQDFGRGNFNFLKGVRWIIGEKQEGYQLEAIFSLFKIIGAMRFHSLEVPFETRDAFMDAIYCCDGKSKKDICKILNRSKLEAQSWEGHSLKMRIEKLIRDLDKIKE